MAAAGIIIIIIIICMRSEVMNYKHGSSSSSTFNVRFRFYSVVTQPSTSYNAL